MEIRMLILMINVRIYKNVLMCKINFLKFIINFFKYFLLKMFRQNSAFNVLEINVLF
jgi:hypothetical protein